LPYLIWYLSLLFMAKKLSKFMTRKVTDMPPRTMAEVFKVLDSFFALRWASLYLARKAGC
jgi:hypothetical protein